ncbi:glycosyltransferase [Trueperella pecoris]|uniref:Glycosyltransferase n=1 Tax=Trueperella pecoris TaxID=2733571 RepID=A0A7M1R0K9_9ACTO|nr:glycosyltransferase [Trueperella pecoris]QOR47254.1 glycosyltransferase [Trueperella pecoris]
MPAMIFHAPYPLIPHSVFASAIRPPKMKAAFVEAGYEVFDLTGTAAERKRKFKVLKAEIAAGKIFDFMYSESATIPPMIGDPNHVPHLFIDAMIFSCLKKHHIPQSVFYRDIYWRFDEYVKRVGRPMAAAIRPLYRAELALYRRYMSTVYLPSMQMADEIPELEGARVDALPPGGTNVDLAVPSRPLHLFYVGSVGPLYQLHELIEAVKKTPEVTFTLCTSKELWDRVSGEYDVAGHSNIRIVHRSGPELLELYAQANIAVNVVAPSHYRDFAVPVKLFEYVNYGKPILASDHTLVSQMVEANDWGWVVNNDRVSIERTLKDLAANPGKVEQATARVEADRVHHTWLARARKVAADLA